MYSTATELLDQQIELFNAASQGTIVLAPAALQGDYGDTAFYKKVSGLVKRRNAYGSGSVASKKLEHLLDTMVKVAAGTPPLEFTKSQFTWIQKSPEEAGVIYGKQLATDMLADMLNTGILGLNAALVGTTNVVYDGSASTMKPTALNSATALFGDRAQEILAWVCHSKPMFDYYGDNLTNTNRLFTYGTVNVTADAFGRPFVISDCTALINTTPDPDQYHSLGLVAGALMVGQNNDFDSNVETKNGDENIIRTIQSEWTYNLGIKGYAWDKTNGGASPTDAALATSTNWDQYATSDKDLAGVLLKTQ
jgi:hypothetical protein